MGKRDAEESASRQVFKCRQRCLGSSPFPFPNAGRVGTGEVGIALVIVSTRVGLRFRFSPLLCSNMVLCIQQQVCIYYMCSANRNTVYEINAMYW